MSCCGSRFSKITLLDELFGIPTSVIQRGVHCALSLNILIDECGVEMEIAVDSSKGS